MLCCAAEREVCVHARASPKNWAGKDNSAAGLECFNCTSVFSLLAQRRCGDINSEMQDVLIALDAL